MTAAIGYARKLMYWESRGAAALIVTVIALLTDTEITDSIGGLRSEIAVIEWLTDRFGEMARFKDVW
ncbi:MAG: hypothetical protein WKF92_01935 [Pyrinomonadaceae bacterium]